MSHIGCMAFLQKMVARNKLLFFVIAAVFAVHVGSFAYFSFLAAGNPHSYPYPIVGGDSVRYVMLSENMRMYGTYENPSDTLTPRIYPPGYPLFLAVSKTTTGSYIPVIVLQALLALVAVALIYNMAAQFVPPRFAAAAALLYGIEPMVVFLNTSILSDSLFSSLLIVAVYLAFFYIRPAGFSTSSLHARSLARWGIVGILLATATMIRSISLYLIPLAPVAYLYYERSNAQWRTKILSIGVFVLATSIILVPWMIRNHEQYGVYEISHSGPFNVLHNFARPFLVWKATGMSPGVALLVPRMTETSPFKAVDQQLDARLKTMTPTGEDPWNYQGKLAKEIVLGDPLRYAYFHSVNMAPFFLASSVSAYQQYVHQIGSNTDFYAPTMVKLVHVVSKLKQAPLSAWPTILFGVMPIAIEILLWAAISISALFVLRKKDVRLFYLFCMVAYFAILTGPMAIARYRIPAEPYLFILAAVGLYEIIRRFQNRNVIEKAQVAR